MGIVNRRNAVLGWTVWQVGKRFGKKKARDAVPGFEEGSKRPNKGAIVSGLAAIGGAFWFWRRRKDDGPPDPG
jgi:LPXTG-motif cell wall-anchored protein